jgi:hypothetical protein
VASGSCGRGGRILRSAPWLPLLAGTGAAMLLLLGAGAGHGSGFAPVMSLLGLAACGGAAAYVLDEESTAVLDATPTSLAHRVLWRLVLVAMPAAAAMTGLLLLDRLDPSTHWLRMVPFAAGCLAIGVVLAAVLRRGGHPAPGDLASVVAVAVVVLLVATEPLRAWVSVAPLGDTRHAGRTVLLWAAVVLACGAVTAWCSRDPGVPHAGPAASSGAKWWRHAELNH